MCSTIRSDIVEDTDASDICDHHPEHPVESIISVSNRGGELNRSNQAKGRIRTGDMRLCRPPRLAGLCHLGAPDTRG